MRSEIVAQSDLDHARSFCSRRSSKRWRPHVGNRIPEVRTGLWEATGPCRRRSDSNGSRTRRSGPPACPCCGTTTSRTCAAPQPRRSVRRLRRKHRAVDLEVAAVDRVAEGPYARGNDVQWDARANRKSTHSTVTSTSSTNGPPPPRFLGRVLINRMDGLNTPSDVRQLRPVVRLAKPQGHDSPEGPRQRPPVKPHDH